MANLSSWELAAFQQAVLPNYTSMLGPTFYGPTPTNVPQIPLSMLADFVVNHSSQAVLGGKRVTASDDLGMFRPLSPAKKIRAKSPDSIPIKAGMSRPKKLSSLADHPALMARLATLGGGFPMPCARVGRSSSDQGSMPRLSPLSRKRSVSLPYKSVRRGGFPLPKLSGGSIKTTQKKNMNLGSFKALWKETDPQLRKEVLSMKLERGNVKIV